MRLRQFTVGLIACLALADLAGAAWLWVLWQERSAQPTAWAQAPAAQRPTGQRSPSVHALAAGDAVPVSGCLRGMPDTPGSSSCP